MTVHIQEYPVSQILLLVTLVSVGIILVSSSEWNNPELFSFAQIGSCYLMYLHLISSSSQSTGLKHGLYGKRTARLREMLDPLAHPSSFTPCIAAPPGGSVENTPRSPPEAGDLPSCTHRAGIEAMVQELMWTPELITWAKGELFDSCLHFRYICPGEFFGLHLLFALYLGTSFYP